MTSLFTSSLQEHNKQLIEVKRLRENNLKLQPDKCEFLRKEVIYLGHIITEHGDFCFWYDRIKWMICEWAEQRMKMERERIYLR